MNIDAASVTHWQTWIGRTESRSEILEAESLRRFAAAIGEDRDVERNFPSLGHWAFFLPVVGPDEIGVDGHPKRGGFLPPVDLPRRMFAAAQMQFSGALRIGEVATRTSVIRDVVHKAGRSGDLVLVKVEHRIAQQGIDRVVEVQTIVYRDAGGRTPAVEPALVEAADGDVLWQPGPVDLFRFSAVTFNSHRIHYDLPYATGEEGYPSLVVHGPFTATKLFGHARRKGQRPARFSFRAAAPLFCGSPILLADQPDGAVQAVRCDGVAAMIAQVEY